MKFVTTITVVHEAESAQLGQFDSRTILDLAKEALKPSPYVRAVTLYSTQVKSV